MKQFTRDEAIAIVRAHRGVYAVLTVEPMTNARREYIAGVRAALEALAAAGAFVAEPPCSRCNGRGGPLVQVPSLPGGIGKMKCAECGNRPQQTMSDKLDAAGIR